MSKLSTKKMYIFIDESGTSDDSQFLYMSAVVTDSPHDLRIKCESLIKEIHLDPELSQNIESIQKYGMKHLHYSADHDEIRRKVIDMLPTLNFSGYLIFARKNELTGNLSKVDQLKLLLENLVRPRLLEKHYKYIEIIYESFDEASSVVEKEFSNEVSIMCKRLSKQFGKEIKNVSVSFNDKTELCLGIPDYLCGVVSDYFKIHLTSGSKDKVKYSWQIRNYNRVAGKIRMIQDLTRKKFYSRKAPLDIELI